MRTAFLSNYAKELPSFLNDKSNKDHITQGQNNILAAQNAMQELRIQEKSKPPSSITPPFPKKATDSIVWRPGYKTDTSTEITDLTKLLATAK